MDDPSPDAGPRPQARLLIHAGGADPGPRTHETESPLRRLRALYSAGPQHDTRATLRLQIDDLQGRRMLSLEDADPLVDIELPPGTYHVSAQLGDLRRGYTMTLGHGAPFDLYLRFAGHRDSA
jgi:hypothetical protein